MRCCLRPLNQVRYLSKYYNSTMTSAEACSVSKRLASTSFCRQLPGQLLVQRWRSSSGNVRLSHLRISFLLFYRNQGLRNKDSTLPINIINNNGCWSHCNVSVLSCCIRVLSGMVSKDWHGDADCGNAAVTAVFTAVMGMTVAVIQRGWDR